MLKKNSIKKATYNSKHGNKSLSRDVSGNKSLSMNRFKMLSNNVSHNENIENELQMQQLNSYNYEDQRFTLESLKSK